MTPSTSSSNSDRRFPEGQKPHIRPPRYEYSKLEGKDIRLAILLPGRALDPIRMTISHAPLIPPDHGSLPPSRWSKEELQRSMPVGKVHQTLDEKFLFDIESGTSWTHPNPNFDPMHYQLPEDYPYPDFEPEYEALSYFWGDPKETETIYIQTPTESRSLEIGHNLAVALQHLRYEDNPRSLWVDAICINQEDSGERSAQVRRMASIYKMAYRVVVWLGPESADSTLALLTIARIGAQVECIDDLSQYCPLPGCTELELELDREDLFESLTEQHWESLDHLLKREWFSRLWVMQEIRLANRRATVQCGREQIKWNYFGRAFISIWDQCLPSRDFRARVLGTRKLMGKVSPRRAAVLLSWSAYTKCLDPRDKVYAILGLVDSEFSGRIQPQYSLPKAEVYKAATVAHVELYQKLALLQQCSISYWEPGLPTWVPDWAKAPPSTLLEERLNNASGLSSSSALFLAPDILEVVGILCARVAEIHKNEYELQLSASSQSKLGGRYITRQSLARAIVASLIANRCWERHPDQPRLPSLDVLEADFLKTYPPLEEGKSFNNFVSFPENVEHQLHRYKSGRVLFQTDEGFIGLGPQGMEPGRAVLLTRWVFCIDIAK